MRALTCTVGGMMMNANNKARGGFRAAGTLLLVAAVKLALNCAWAQTADANLRGTASPNAMVTAVDAATGATRRTTANAQGAYALVGLAPGTYKVDAGPGTETMVTLSVASTATLDLQPAPPPAATTTVQEVVVQATRPTEVKTSEVGTVISQQEIASTPQLTRNFLEFADLAPGVAFSVDASGHTSLTGGSQTTSSTNVFIDGVGQKSYVMEGGTSGQFYTQGNPFPQLAIGEYKVITSNYKAEFDQVSSAAITADTKSGTNEFHGEAFGTYTDANLRAETPAEIAAAKKTSSHDAEFGAALGGPIIQNVMHFFVTYEGKRYNTPVAVTPGVTDISTSVLPASVAAQFGPSSLPFSEDLLFGKLDFEPSDKDRFEISAKVRDESDRENIGLGKAASSAIDVKNYDTRIDARWQHSEDRWLNELRATYEDAYYRPTALSYGNGSIYTAQSENDQQFIDVGPSSPLSEQNKAQHGPGLQDDFTLNDLHWYGDHTVKTGAKFKAVTLTAQDAADINPQFYYDVSSTGTATDPYKVLFPNPVAGLSPSTSSRDQQFGVYLQDDWVVTPQWTINIGVRWDYERNPSYLNYVTPAAVVAALNSQDPNAPTGQTYAQTLAKGGVNINDYISNGHNRSAPTNEWQPRLGFSFDVNADQKHVVFGGYGRSYDRDLYDYLQVEQTKAALPEDTIYFNEPERPCTLSPTCVTWNPSYYGGLSNVQGLVAATTAGQEIDLINNHLKAPYSDQFSIGMRNRVGDWNTSVAIARILSYDGFAFTLGNRYPDGSFWQNGGQPWGNGVPGYGSLIIGGNGIETRNTEVLLSAEKPYTEESRWGATFAYTYTNATLNRDTIDHYSFDEETIGQYPFIRSDAAARHRLVATGTVRGPWRLEIATKITLATPIPYDNVEYLPSGMYFANGSSGQPVSGTPPNTLGYKDIDFQVTKNFDLPHDTTVYVRLDLLNAFNFRNYADYTANWVTAAGVPERTPVVYNYTGDIFGVPRELKLTAGARF